MTSPLLTESYSVQVLSSPSDRLPQWENYFARLEQRSLYHAPSYIRFFENYYKEEAELFIYGNEREFIYYPYFKRSMERLAWLDGNALKYRGFFDISSSWYYGGPLASLENPSPALVHGFLSAFEEHAARCGFVTEFIRFDANLYNHSLFPQGALVFDRQTVYVDLIRTENEIWDGFSVQNRRAIRKAQKNGFECMPTPEETAWRNFFEIYHREMGRKGAPTHLDFPWEFFLELRDKLEDNVCLLSVASKGQFCGGFIVAYDAHFAFHFLSATQPEFWPERINNLLYYEALQWAHRKGLKRFDFMGGRPGVFRFKCNFSQERGKFWVYRKIHRPELYAELAALAKTELESSQEGSFFPFYRNPMLQLKERA